MSRVIQAVTQTTKTPPFIPIIYEDLPPSPPPDLSALEALLGDKRPRLFELPESAKIEEPPIRLGIKFFEYCSREHCKRESAQPGCENGYGFFCQDRILPVDATSDIQKETVRKLVDFACEKTPVKEPTYIEIEAAWAMVKADTLSVRRMFLKPLGSSSFALFKDSLRKKILQNFLNLLSDGRPGPF